MLEKLNLSETISQIGNFLRGKNEKLKYVVNVETYNYHNYANCVIHEPGKQPYVHREKFTAFLYLKNIKKYGIELYGGNQEILDAQMKAFEVTMENLETGGQPRLENGYTIKVSSTKSYNSIINFLKAGGLDMWQQDDDLESKNRHLFNTLSLDEQFFISTGVRLFKGIDTYTGVHKLVFDIETTGLKPFNSRVFLIGLRDNRGFETILKVEKEDDDYEEMIMIEKFFGMIDYIKPAIIAGYNSEEFDFYFLLERAKILGMMSEEKFARSIRYISSFKTTLSDEMNEKTGSYRHVITRKPNSSVKFGNTANRYTATQMWGYSVIDIQHAAKKTAALNTEIKNVKLKYIAQYEGIAKADRMYIKGDHIGSMWKEDIVYICNPENNQYEKIPAEYQVHAESLIKLQKLRATLPEDQYVAKRATVYATLAKEFVEWLRSNFEKYTNKFKLVKGGEIVERYLLDDLWETDKVDSLYNQSSFMLAKLVPTSYTRVATMGSAAVWNILMTTWSFGRGLAIPIPDESESFSGGLARCFRKGLNKRIVKLDFASLYPMLQLTYDIFPQFDIDGVIKKMLLYLSMSRNIYKNLAGKKKLKADQVELLKVIDEEMYHKYINNIAFTAEELNMFKVKQLPIKILNNSLFGALGSAIAFNWSDNVCASRITVTGRLHLREMIMWFNKYEFIPLLAVTDGVNFTYPETSKYKLDGSEVDVPLPIDEIWKYVVDGKELCGVKAIVEKFNEEIMPKPFMGVDMDGIWTSSLNLSRINYANLDEKGKIKLTGNTIKSKVMPEYIVEFIDKGLDKILAGDGEGFVDYYNEYLEKIFFKQIPLKKIATKKKVKLSISGYRNRGTDKNGRPKAKMAYMEAIIMERDAQVKKLYEEEVARQTAAGNCVIPSVETAELKFMYEEVGQHLPPEPELDSYVYYVNVGTKKGHADSKIIDDENGNKILACKLISANDLENNPEMLGTYNSAKYVESFNKRAKALLEGFEPSIRKMILVSDPKNREHFSTSELELKSFPADDLQASLVLEEKELEFWNRTGLNPSKIWDGYVLPEPNALEELDEYEEKIKYLNDKFAAANDPRRVKSVNESIGDGELVLHKNFNIYDLYQRKGNNLNLLRSNMFAPKEEQDYDFMKIGLSKKSIEMKTEMAKLLKEKAGISQETKLSTIPNGLMMLENFIKAELAARKEKEQEEEEVFDDENDD